MKKHEKINYVMKWKKKNKNILDVGGLLEPKMGDFTLTIPIKFMSGIFISISAAKLVVPHLQRVFQADACQMNFGKYTTLVMEPQPIATHFQLHWQSCLGAKTRRVGFSSGPLQRAFIHRWTKKIQPSSPIKPRVWKKH
jgi:hypothetical protein